MCPESDLSRARAYLVATQQLRDTLMSYINVEAQAVEDLDELAEFEAESVKQEEKKKVEAYEY